MVSSTSPSSYTSVRRSWVSSSTRSCPGILPAEAAAEY
jgi:hypothetical protein